MARKDARRLASREALIWVALLAIGYLVAGCMGDSFGYGSAWEDTNCDGDRDHGEAPLAGVCVWSSTHVDAPTPSREECATGHLQTDRDGWGGWAFYAGASCADVFVFAGAPDGYQPTTDTVVNDCDAEFGFAAAGACPQRPIVTQSDLVARQARKQLASYLVWFLIPATAIGIGVLLVKLRARLTG